MPAPTPFMKSPNADIVKVSAKFMRAVDYVLEAAALFVDVDKKWKASSDSDIDIMCHLHCFVMAHSGHHGAMPPVGRYQAVEIAAWKIASIYRQIVLLEGMVATEVRKHGVQDLAEDLLLLGMDAKTLSSSFDIIRDEHKKLAR